MSHRLLMASHYSCYVASVIPRSLRRRSFELDSVMRRVRLLPWRRRELIDGPLLGQERPAASACDLLLVSLPEHILAQEDLHGRVRRGPVALNVRLPVFVSLNFAVVIPYIFSRYAQGSLNLCVPQGPFEFLLTFFVDISGPRITLDGLVRGQAEDDGTLSDGAADSSEGLQEGVIDRWIDRFLTHQNKLIHWSGWFVKWW